MKKILFTIDENQQKNLFDLCVGIFVSIVVFLCFAINKPIPQQARDQTTNLNTNQNK